MEFHRSKKRVCDLHAGAAVASAEPWNSEGHAQILNKGKDTNKLKKTKQNCSFCYDVEELNV